MHYRNGREAKNGDLVVQINFDGSINNVGRLHGAVPGHNYCNGTILSLDNGVGMTACLCDCLHMDDVTALLVEKGWDKRPEGA